MRRLLLPLVLALVVAACAENGTTSPDLLSGARNPTIAGDLAFIHHTDALLGVAGIDDLTLEGNATFAPDTAKGFPVTYKLVSGTGYMTGKVVRYLGDALCTYEGGRSVRLVPGDGAFTISRGASATAYSGHIKLRVTFPVTANCMAGRTQITLPEELLAREMDLKMEGTYTDQTIVGVMTPYDIGPIHCTGSWKMYGAF